MYDCEADDARWHAVSYSKAKRQPRSSANSAAVHLDSGPYEAVVNAIRRNWTVLVIMRGIPGSGKTTVARGLANMRPDATICSADEYFMTSDGVYAFNPSRLDDAHRFCFAKAVSAFERRISLVIIDNTNVQSWEMKRYVTAGYRHRYRIFFLEPSTPWKYDAAVCASKNSHGVSVTALQRMVSMFEHNVRFEDFINPTVHMRPSSYGAANRGPESSQQIRSTSLVVGNAVDRSEKRVAVGWASNDEAANDCEQSSSTHWLGSEKDFPRIECANSEEQENSSSEKSESHSNDANELVAECSVDLKPCFVTVVDVAIQAYEPLISLVTSDHPKCSEDNLDPPVERGPYRSVVSSFAVDRRDQIVFVDFDGSNDREDALVTLRNCFPSIAEDDLTHIFDSCGRDLQWSINVLLDSGYELQWSALKVAEESKVEDSMPSCSGETANSAHCVMELSPDMAVQLQQLFGFIFKDIPPDLLEPQQLKVQIPMDFAYNLYNAWAKSQRSNNAAQITDDDLNLIDSELTEFSIESELPNKIDPKAMSSKLKMKSLIEMFPSVDPEFLEDLFNANGCILGSTVDTVCQIFEMPKPEMSGVLRLKDEDRKVYKAMSLDAMDKELPSYWDLRTEAFHHQSERDYNFKRAQETYRNGMKGVAYHYAQQGKYHDRKYKDANSKAADIILEYRRCRNPGDTLDLHGLHVREALAALSRLLQSAGTGKRLKVITGRGIHSNDGAKIYPAVVKYLKQKKLDIDVSTPGVVVVIT